MPSQALPDHVSALLRKNAYPHAVNRIELVQTHISFVFLVDDQVYKLKKPVDFGFLDFSTLDKRKAACDAEVRLNQRGCPAGVYLGVEQLTRRDGAYHVGGEGETVDYLVHMKRLPAEGMLDRLLERGAVDLSVLGRVAARLAELHRQAERGPEITRLGGTAQQARNWQESIRGLRPFIGRTLGARRLERIGTFVDQFSRREAALLERREQEGWIRDGHGDLRSDSVCFDPSLPGGICLFDCIEFNDALRYSDTALDAAFLAMDLDYRGRPDLSDLFIGLYTAAVGDMELPLLLDLYKCYRAVVRGKVESLLLDDPAVSRRQKAAARRRARAYFALAESYARKRRRQTLVMVSGPSGSGKSVLAGTLAAHRGAVLLSTDMTRQQLFESARGQALDTGVYAPAARESVYGEMQAQAVAALAQGRSVVLDGTFLEAQQRRPFLDLARTHRLSLLLVECDAPEPVIQERQRTRQAEPWTTSEGRWEVYLAQKASAEPPAEVAAAQRLTIDTTRPLAEQVMAIEARLDAG